MSIPTHISDVLGCSADLSEDDFRNYVDSLNGDRTPWFLAGEAAKEALVKAIFQGDARLVAHAVPYELEDAPDARYYIATESGSYAYSLIYFGSSCSSSDDFPTAALVELAGAWPGLPDVLTSAPDPGPAGNALPEVATPAGVGEIPVALRGRALILRRGVAENSPSHLNIHPVLLALAGLRVVVDPIRDPQWTECNSVELDASGLVHRPEMMSGNLLQEALCETRPRWRFVALYRVFESAYLLAVRDAFMDTFFSNPKAATDKTKKALEAEVNQFEEVVKLHQLQSYFEAVTAEVDALPANEFLQAVRRDIAPPNRPPVAWETGVAIIYKLRCSIVHAGQKSVIFDRYPDGNVALIALTPLLEKAVLALLGLRVD